MLSRRLLAVAALIAVLGRSSAAASRVRITSPVEDAYLSGRFALVAVVEPGADDAQVKEVVFFADGRQGLHASQAAVPVRLGRRRSRRRAHDPRRRRSTRKAGARPRPCRPSGVKFAEAVDVDVVQLTAVVTDRNGRFVTRPESRGLQGLRQRPAADDHQLSVGEHRPRAGRRRSTSARACATALPQREGIGQAVSRRAARPAIRSRCSPSTTTSSRWRRGRRDQARASAAIDRMRAWGGTALYDVVVDALESARRLHRPAIAAALQRRRRSVEPRLARSRRSRAPKAATRRSTPSARAARCARRELQTILTRSRRISGGRAFFTEDVVAARSSSSRRFSRTSATSI